MVKLTKTDRATLADIADGNAEIGGPLLYDCAGRPSFETLIEDGLIEWEDFDGALAKVTITDAGHAALAKKDLRNG